MIVWPNICIVGIRFPPSLLGTCQRSVVRKSIWPVTDFRHQSSFPSLERKDAKAILNLVLSFNVRFLRSIFFEHELSSTSSQKISLFKRNRLESTKLDLQAPSSRWYTPLCMYPPKVWHGTWKLGTGKGDSYWKPIIFRFHVKHWGGYS